MKFKSLIPNAFTLGNLFCGVGAVYLASQGNLSNAAILILVGAFLDFFDGFAARLLNVPSELGLQLDSLADLISFGLAPAFIAANLSGAFETEPDLLSFIPFTIAGFGAYRLAKFNIDKSQTDSFKGLPIPSNALFWLSIPLSLDYSDSSDLLYPLFVQFANSPLALGITAIGIGFLMISTIPLMSLKFKSFKWRDNKWRFILIISSLLLLGMFSISAIPIILSLYILISLIENYLTNAIRS